MVLSTVTTFTLCTFFDVASSQNPPLFYIVFDLTYGMLYIVVGAYVGTWIAKTKFTYTFLGALFILLGTILLAEGNGFYSSIMVSTSSYFANNDRSLFWGIFFTKNEET